MYICIVIQRVLPFFILYHNFIVKYSSSVAYGVENRYISIADSSEGVMFSSSKQYVFKVNF